MANTLADTLGPVRFADLRAHVARGAVIVVAGSLDLLVVGDALARDDKAQVAAWLADGLLQKPSVEMLERWSRATGDVGDAIVVQPFVLLRERLG